MDCAGHEGYEEGGGILPRLCVLLLLYNHLCLLLESLVVCSEECVGCYYHPRRSPVCLLAGADQATQSHDFVMTEKNVNIFYNIAGRQLQL